MIEIDKRTLPARGQAEEFDAPCKKPERLKLLSRNDCRGDGCAGLNWSKVSHVGERRDKLSTCGFCIGRRAAENRNSSEDQVLQSMIRSALVLSCLTLMAGCAVGPYKTPGRIGENKYELAYGADRYAASIQINKFCVEKGYARAAPLKDFGAAVVFSCAR